MKRFILCLAVWSCVAVWPGAEAATRYVWTNSPSPSAPYDAWSNAAHDIQTAIDAASSGDLVLVTNGVYASGGKAAVGGTNRVVLDKALTVRSVNGPELTVIAGNGPVDAAAVRCAYIGADAVLAGFTLTNGFTTSGNSGGGVYCAGDSSVLSNCVVTGCTAAQYGGGVFRVRCGIVLWTATGRWG